MKLRKAANVYFVLKDSPKKMDYRFGYSRTPESELKFRIGQWWRGHDNKLHRHMFSKRYDTRDEAQKLVDQYNADLIASCPWLKDRLVIEK